MFNATLTQRLFFFNGAMLSLIGLWLTGFQHVHWFAYVLPAGLLFAAATGFCLGLFMSRKILELVGIQD